jgi:propionate CoA-transferase
MSKIVDAASAVSLIADGSSVGCVGVIGWVTPDALLKALEIVSERRLGHQI